MCWAVREAARSVGEELMCFSMGAQGGSRAVGMWEGAAILVAGRYERVASGGGVAGCALLLIGGGVGGGGGDTPWKGRLLVALSRPIRLEKAACQRWRVGVERGERAHMCTPG